MPYEIILGPEAIEFVEPVKLVIDALTPSEYHFISNDDFRNLAARDIKSAHAQYWREIVYRAHFAAAASLVRSYSWLRGMRSAYDSENFLLFCASFRALIESAADSYDALNNVCTTLAKNSALIEDALSARAPTFISCTELENQLIHFSHARQIKKGDEAPESHQAKFASHYIKSLESAGCKKLYECYSELCQYTHPAAQSIAHMMIPLSHAKWIFIHGSEREKISATSENYRDLMLPLLTFAFNPSFVCLKVLRHLSVEACHCNTIDEIDMSHVKAWMVCHQHLKQGAGKPG